jgi:phosphoserine phosphatase
MKTIAIFDLDKTLIPFDCDEAWGPAHDVAGSRQQCF